MSHFSPLLWLCAVSAAALNSFTALDPTGAYEQYLDALGENTPAIAAFFDAAESGVFPWTIPGVSEPIPSPVPDLLPQPPEVVDPVIPDEPEEPVSQFTTVDASYFDDALFLGDSHTDGFHDYAGLGNATYFTKNGLTVKDIVEKSFIELDGKKVTLAEALGTRQFGKVYILLGINEIGACRMCVVDTGARALSAACVMPVSEGTLVVVATCGRLIYITTVLPAAT